MLQSEKATGKLEIASISKMMTFLVILRLVKEDSSLRLEEEVKISETSAALGGTTAYLRKGDSLTVYDLLHGMMLPSGNDAAHALACHFGSVTFLQEPPLT